MRKVILTLTTIGIVVSGTAFLEGYSSKNMEHSEAYKASKSSNNSIIAVRGEKLINKPGLDFIFSIDVWVF